MGTEIMLSAWTTDEPKAERAFAAGYDEIRRIEILMTDWERPGEPESDVVRINKAAGKEAVRVSAETFEVIEKSLEMSRRSRRRVRHHVRGDEGAVEVRRGSGEEAAAARREIARRRKLINWRDVVVDAKARTVKLRRPGMRLGLGGIAKGYAVDRGAAVLRGEGCADFMVQAGGDLYVAGSKGAGELDGRRARSARRTRDDDHRAHADQGPRVLDGGRLRALRSCSTASATTTSSIRATGYPATASREVTIFAPTAFLADALDDAVFILGPEEGAGAGRVVPRLLDGDRRREKSGVDVEGAGGEAAADRAPDGRDLSI